MYLYTYRDVRAISYAYDMPRPGGEVVPGVAETWLETDDPTGELQRLTFPHQITGLQHASRQLRAETQPFNPLFKSIQGASTTLGRILGAPNPLRGLRAVTVSLEPGDTVFVEGQVTVAPRLRRLLCLLTDLEHLRRVSVEGNPVLFDAEEHAVFAAMAMVLWKRRGWGDGDSGSELEVVFTPSKVFGNCALCEAVICRCLTCERWADCVEVVVREI